MTPEGYKQIVAAVNQDVRHGPYEVHPEPQEGEDLWFVTISREDARALMSHGDVLYHLGKAGLLEYPLTDAPRPHLTPEAFLPNSITLRDFGSKHKYNSRSGDDQPES